MRHFKDINIADLLVLLVPLTLIVPNIIVAAFASVAWLAKIAVTALPLGLYLLLMSLWRRSTISTIIAFPLMVLAAFQIVIISLYDSPDPIGVDMFLNVVTSNSSEVIELLSGLLGPLAFVAVLYLTDIVLAIIGLKRKSMASKRYLRFSMVSGFLIFIFGLAAGLTSHLSVRNDLFPINALDNLLGSVVRYQRIHSYSATSESFSYGAKSENDSIKEVYIAVVGETARADNWSVLGYERNTNPLLTARKDSLFAFRKAFSESNTTHKAVPMLLTTLTANNFEDSIYTHKSIITAFKEAGFYTTFVSNQERNGSFIEYYEQEADSFVPLHNKNDRYALPVIDSLLAANRHDKLLLVVHLYGSHYNYNDRYDKENALFSPDEIGVKGTAAQRKNMVNAYDNSIANTDFTLNSIAEMLDRTDAQGGMIYCSDHGEDIFDDDRNRFLHASPSTSYWQLHVPLIAYLNASYRSKYPEKAANLRSNEQALISSSRSYSHSLLDMAGIATPYLDKSSSLLSSSYEAPKSLSFLNDKNESVSLKKAGFSSTDEILLKKVSIR